MLIWVTLPPLPQQFHRGKGDSALPRYGLLPDVKGCMKNYNSPEYYKGLQNTFQADSSLRRRVELLCAMWVILCCTGVFGHPEVKVNQHVL